MERVFVHRWKHAYMLLVQFDIGDDPGPPRPIAFSIQTKVTRDSKKPRPQALRRIQLAIGAISTQPCFLEKVEGVFAVPGGPEDETHDLAFVTMHRLVKRRRQIKLRFGVPHTRINPAHRAFVKSDSYPTLRGNI